MTDIHIVWLSDSTECDQAGCSGGFAEGAMVYFDGKLRLDLSPVASCFGGDHYGTEEVFGRILNELGHKLVGTEYG